MKQEIWIESPVYGDCYQVSTFGRVKSMPRVINSSHGSTRTLKERILKDRMTQHGYKMITLSNQGCRNHIFVHRLVARAFIDNPRNKDFCNHIDGNKTNNHVENIEWCTRSENMIHAYDNRLIRERDYKGKNSPRTKLVDADIIDIRTRYNAREKVRDIADIYRLKKPAIYNIISGRSWSHIRYLLN